MGGDVKEYQILLSPERMRFHNVDMSDVLDATDLLNSNTNGSILHEFGNEYLIKGQINTTDTLQLSLAAVRSTDGNIVKLADIAEVTIGSAYPKLGLATEKGKPAVLITVAKQKRQIQRCWWRILKILLTQ